MISLDRSPPYTGHNIQTNSEHYYRGVVADSYDDLWEQSESGLRVMRGRGKGGTDRLSFQKAFPNDLYVNGLVRANTIIEGDNRMPIEEHQKRTGYTFVGELQRDKVESGETPIRVYQRRMIGGQALHLTHVWHKVFDSFPADAGDHELK